MSSYRSPDDTLLFTVISLLKALESVARCGAGGKFTQPSPSLRYLFPSKAKSLAYSLWPRLHSSPFYRLLCLFVSPAPLQIPLSLSTSTFATPGFSSIRRNTVQTQVSCFWVSCVLLPAQIRYEMPVSRFFRLHVAQGSSSFRWAGKLIKVWVPKLYSGKYWITISGCETEKIAFHMLTFLSCLRIPVYTAY